MSEFRDDPFSRRADELFRNLELETDAQLDPLPPSRVRELGNRRRTRRRAGIAAGAVGLTAVVATTVTTLGGGLPGSSQRVDPAANPSHSAPASKPSLATATASGLPTAGQASGRSVPTVTVTQTAPSTPEPSTPGAKPAPSASSTDTSGSTPAASTSPVAGATPSPTNTTDPKGSDTFSTVPTWEDVASTAQVYWHTPGDLELTSQQDSWGSANAMSACVKDPASLRPSLVLRRDFGGSPATNQSVNVQVAVMNFDSIEQVTAARKQIRAWYYNCTATLKGAGYSDVKASSAVDVPLSDAVTAVNPHQGSFRSIAMTNPSSGVGSFEDATVIQAGNRLEWVVYTVISQDDNWAMSSSDGTGLPLYPGIARASQIADRLLP